MSILQKFRVSLKSIEDYKKKIDNHNSNKEYGPDIVKQYNKIGEDIEELTSLIEETFSNEILYMNHFESDEIQDELSDALNKAFNSFSRLIQLKKCEEKVTLAYEWLFEVMLFTTDDEEIKSRITLNSNGIKLISPTKKYTGKLSEENKVKINVKSGSMTESITVIAEEIVDDYIYAYLGDRENEQDLIIFHRDYIA